MTPPAPTRLLDWSRSPLIGLWFATYRGGPTGTDAALWVLHEGLCYEHLPFLDEIPQPGTIPYRTWANLAAEAAIERRSMVLLPLQPSRDEPRVIAQQSVLSVVGDVGLAIGVVHHNRSMQTTKVRVPRSWAPAAATACANLAGISELSVFRDLDALGRELFECESDLSRRHSALY